MFENNVNSDCSKPSLEPNHSFGFPGAFAALRHCALWSGCGQHRSLSSRLAFTLAIVAAGFSALTGQAQITTEHINTKVYLGPAIDKASPAFGPGDTSVMITGGDLSGVTAVTFGGMQAGFTVLSNTAIKAIAPLKGVPGSMVPVSAVSNGQVVPTSAFYSYPIAEMDVTGPIPFARGTVGDPTWYNGVGHLISVGPPQTLPLTVRVLARRQLYRGFLFRALNVRFEPLAFTRRPTRRRLRFEYSVQAGAGGREHGREFRPLAGARSG